MWYWLPLWLQERVPDSVRAGLKRKTDRLARVLQTFNVPQAPQQQGVTVAANLQPLIDQITATEGVLDSAVTFIIGVPALITQAVSDATANGATAAQLQPVTDLGTALKSKADALQAAITANSPTPVVPPTVPPVVPPTPAV